MSPRKVLMTMKQNKNMQHKRTLRLRQIDFSGFQYRCTLASHPDFSGFLPKQRNDFWGQDAMEPSLSSSRITSATVQLPPVEI